MRRTSNNGGISEVEVDSVSSTVYWNKPWITSYAKSVVSYVMDFDVALCVIEHCENETSRNVIEKEVLSTLPGFSSLIGEKASEGYRCSSKERVLNTRIYGPMNCAEITPFHYRNVCLAKEVSAFA